MREILKENKKFEKFKHTLNFTGSINLLELYYLIEKDLDFEKAEEVIGIFKEISIEPNLKDIKMAAKFRIENAKKKFSYINCPGYSIGINRGMKFLTGDEGFKNIRNVEFMKK